MKKVLSCCLGIVVLIVVLLFVGVQAMPTNYDISHTQVVSGSPDEVFAIASDLHTWPDWTYWSREADPSAVWDWSGAPGSVGSNMSWKGEKHLEGSLTLPQ